MQYVNNSGNASVVLDIALAIHENAAYLSEIDGATGDGDHGINMNKGFMLAKKRITENMKLSEAFRILGDTLFMDIGGSMGPIYGTMFSQIGKTLNDIEFITDKTLLSALDLAMDRLMQLADARVGDKTLLDALHPAKEAYRDAIADGKAYGECLAALSDGAEEGKESTKNLVAKIGRAARLGERSKGFLDAGAASCCIMLKALANSMQERIVDEPI